jgi:hypothetical protein
MANAEYIINSLSFSFHVHPICKFPKNKIIFSEDQYFCFNLKMTEKSYVQGLELYFK